MTNELAHIAIQAALTSKWKKALEINKAILEKDPHNIDAMNRSAKACYELEMLEDAIFYTKKVLEIDPVNGIATKSIVKYRIGKNNSSSSKSLRINRLSQRRFLEEPGKTKVVKLINLGEKDCIFSLCSGDKVNLNIGRFKVSVQNNEGRYVGKCPDDISNRLVQLIKQGGVYEAYIKAAQPDCVSVLIREVQNFSNGTHIPSFPIEKKS